MTYRTGALDYFDTIFVTSRYQGIEVREIEALRNTKKKKIVKYGYGLIDNMIAAYNALEHKAKRKSRLSSSRLRGSMTTYWIAALTTCSQELPFAINTRSS